MSEPPQSGWAGPSGQPAPGPSSVDPFYVEGSASQSQYGGPAYDQSPYGPPQPAPQYGPVGYGPSQYGGPGRDQSPYGPPQHVQYGYVQYDAPTISVPPIPGVEPPLNRPYYGIGFGKAFKRAFRKYATFSGRASPSEYWWFQLVNILVVTVAFACFAVFGGLGFYGWAGTAHSYGTPDAVWMMAWLLPPGLLFLWGLATFIPNLALVWRRLHDSGHSGAWYLLPFLALPILELSVRYVTFGVGSRLFRLLNMAVSVTILVFLIQGPSPKGVRWDR